MMLGRGLATCGIWLSPAVIMWMAQGGRFRGGDVLVLGYIAAMVMATAVVWMGAETPKV